ncbi:uncharacterized protein LOC127266450 [Andrographis paniculata]|uniref:uncharacterized protein LOC127266450 n=1 Tax=Andrographis paniculata TaxID=175694 RepID=UPI0021E7266A|nr:uncharacterized protein LOC127266450 [Andrographis paniculata]
MATRSSTLTLTLRVLLLLLVSFLLLLHFAAAASVCRPFCNNIPIRYPFGIDDGCGAALFRPMLNCSGSDLFFVTPSGSYKIQSIDYSRRTLTVFDPSMTTCSILQPRHDFLMTDIQWATVPPSPDTVFALINCSLDSPVLNHYSSLCFNFSGHSCDELYASCTSFKRFLFSYSSPSANGSSTRAPPPCCFTRYDTVRMMSMSILDCTHYTSVYNADGLRGIGALDWLYGMRLSYSVPDLGCDRCANSGGTCGFDVDTRGFLCICAHSDSNSTRDCGVPVNQVGRTTTSSTFTFTSTFIIVVMLLLQPFIISLLFVFTCELN